MGRDPAETAPRSADVDRTLPVDPRLRRLADPTRWQLVVLAPDGIREIELAHEPCVIGRSGAAGIVIDERSVSREHARITLTEEGPTVEDLGSRNGTFVNDAAVPEGGRLTKAGDTIRFGSVAAHLMHVARADFAASIAGTEEFDSRVASETERGLRFGRPVCVMVCECEGRVEEILEVVRPVTVQGARPLDAIARRSTGRVDLLIAECDREQATAVATEIRERAQRRSLSLRIGVALFPEDAPSAASLLLAAQLALAAAEDGLGMARSAARVVQVGRHEVVVADPAMVRLFAMVDRIASLAMPVLVTGETGTGKEIVAEALHGLGRRRGQQLMKINCAAVPENLLESELFGYERGAFSGAVTAKPGLIEQANGGTLFLDEIGEMAPGLQAKLLRFLEDRTVRRLGAVRDRVVDVRVVAATHRDLREAAEQGTFRSDLYYRLNGLALAVPALRERRGEIPLLVERFAAEAAREAGCEVPSFEAATLVALEQYDWPGNVRELRNVVGRAVVMADDGTVRAEHLPAEIGRSLAGRARAAAAPPSITGSINVDGLDAELREVERSRIVWALEHCGGNQTRAAALLKVPRRTFVSRMAALGITGPRRR